MEETRTPRPPGPLRIIHIVLTVIIAGAFVGFFVGISAGVARTSLDDHPTSSHVADSAPSDVAAALSYRELRTTDIGPNRRWRSEPRDLAASSLDRASVESERGALPASLARRSERRAFNGAPPVIPHPVRQRSSDDCLGCHGLALRLAQRHAGRPPHPILASCQQCHVSAESTGPFATFVLSGSTFAGLAAPVAGPRATPGAPPQIPHSTFMRNDCLSCHGSLGLPGMRTTHPERRSCTQCHAPSASLDQGIAARSAFVPPPDQLDR